MSPELRTPTMALLPLFAADIHRIAVFRALFLGDLLLSLPALNALRQRFPRAEISLLGLPWAAEFAARLPDVIDRFVPFAGYPGLPELPYQPERTAAFLAAQQAHGYDLAIQMHGDGTGSNGLLAQLGARATMGCARPCDMRLDLGMAYQDGRHELLRWLDLLALLDAPCDQHAIKLPLADADYLRAAALVAPFGRAAAPLVGMHLGAKDLARRWPARRFAALGAALHRHCGARLVLTGAAGDAGLTAQVARLLPEQCLDLAGYTDLGAFGALLGQLDLLVTNDTGASHMAAAVGTPSVVLFGPTRPTQFAPLDGERHRVVDAIAHAPAGCDGAAALAQLPVEPVLAAALAQLAASPGRSAVRLERAVGQGALWAD